MELISSGETLVPKIFRQFYKKETFELTPSLIEGTPTFESPTLCVIIFYNEIFESLNPLCNQGYVRDGYSRNAMLFV